MGITTPFLFMCVFYPSHPSFTFPVGGTEVLVPAEHQEIRNVKQAGSSPQRRDYLVSFQKAGTG